LAIIVDKEQKKKDIALSTKELLLNNGINNITISQIAKNASIGKGTIYEYFSNKNEIVFELVNILMQQHNEKKELKLQKTSSTKEKIKIFFSFFYDDEDKELREIYKQFISISLIENDDFMKEFQTKCFYLYRDWMEELLDEGIAKNEISSELKKFINGVFAFAQGVFIMSVTTNAITDLEKEINSQIDNLFDLMGEK
jgi:AcrR family transcriptional regulator